MNSWVWEDKSAKVYDNNAELRQRLKGAQATLPERLERHVKIWGDTFRSDEKVYCQHKSAFPDLFD